MAETERPAGERLAVATAGFVVGLLAGFVLWGGGCAPDGGVVVDSDVVAGADAGFTTGTAELDAINAELVAKRLGAR